jgi:hypothetical protein
MDSVDGVQVQRRISWNVSVFHVSSAMPSGGYVNGQVVVALARSP